jgi:hypothetical protein
MKDDYEDKNWWEYIYNAENYSKTREPFKEESDFDKSNVVASYSKNEVTEVSSSVLLLE